MSLYFSVIKSITNISHLTKLLFSFDVEEVGAEEFQSKNKGLLVIRDEVTEVLSNSHTVKLKSGMQSALPREKPHQSGRGTFLNIFRKAGCVQEAVSLSRGPAETHPVHESQGEGVHSRHPRHRVCEKISRKASQIEKVKLELCPQATGKHDISFLAL